MKQLRGFDPLLYLGITNIKEEEERYVGTFGPKTTRDTRRVAFDTGETPQRVHDVYVAYLEARSALLETDRVAALNNFKRILNKGAGSTDLNKGLPFKGTAVDKFTNK